MVSIAILIPCYNEEKTILDVVKDFDEYLPHATIYVYDNNSTDLTASIAQGSGAVVRKEYKQGKGNVVRSMFRDVEADIYVMVDGDNTYPACFSQEMIDLVLDGGADMVVGDRHSNGSYEVENRRPFHNFGNQLVRSLINRLFGAKLRDVMSGYRVFSRRFVKTMPVQSTGFEIETEMTLHALDKGFLLREIPIDYRDRPNGSFSKLNTTTDGMKVLRTILLVFKDFKPFAFFSIVSALFFIGSLFIGIPVILEFIETLSVTKVPSAILASGLMIISIVSLFSGFILDTMARNHRATYELYLNQYAKD